MTRDQFWQLIESIDRGILDEGDEDRALLPLEAKLELLDVQGLEGFEEQLCQCLYALDGEVYLDESGESSDSGDCFLYARAYVVAQGREIHEATLKDPQLMPKSADQWCEGLLYVHLKAWAKLTGADESEWSYDPSVSYESASNKALWRL